MNKLPAYNLSTFKQALLDVAIKVGVFAVLVLLDFVSAGLSNGAIQLPYAALTLPVLTLIVSQFDAKFVAYAKEDNVPVPTQ